METAFVSIICIALIVVGGMTMSQGFLSSVDTASLGLEKVSERDEGIMRTNLSILSATQPATNRVQVALQNNGQTKLGDFAKWDVIDQYYDPGGTYYVKWLPYTENATLGDDQWRKKGIYLNSENLTAEVFEPGILNPGEEIVIEAKVNPQVGIGTSNLIVTSTPSGIPASIGFSGFS